MKRIISALLTAVIITTPLASCGAEIQKSDNGIRNLYFKDSAKNKKAAATFLNSKSGKTKTVKMKKSAAIKTTAPSYVRATPINIIWSILTVTTHQKT
ncbi:MAG: hypothetical protein IIU39_00780 [Ruminococcus sp.]|nr:hypothetical protein [Ruminococcus sp.]